MEAPHLDHDMPVSETSFEGPYCCRPSPRPPHLCRADLSKAGLFYSLLSDLSCNYDTMRFAVVLVEKSLDSATDSAESVHLKTLTVPTETCPSEDLDHPHLPTCLPRFLYL